MNCILLICESVRDAKHLIKIVDTLPHPLKEIDILSMHPEIRFILENNCISSMTSADFINRQDYEIINSDCIKIYSELEVNVKQEFSKPFSKCFVKCKKIRLRRRAATFWGKLRQIFGLEKKKLYVRSP